MCSLHIFRRMTTLKKPLASFGLDDWITDRQNLSFHCFHFGILHGLQTVNLQPGPFAAHAAHAALWMVADSFTDKLGFAVFLCLFGAKSKRTFVLIFLLWDARLFEAMNINQPFAASQLKLGYLGYCWPTDFHSSSQHLAPFWVLEHVFDDTHTHTHLDALAHPSPSRDGLFSSCSDKDRLLLKTVYFPFYMHPLCPPFFSCFHFTFVLPKFGA